MSKDSVFYMVIAFVVIAIVGFADAVYLTASHYLGGVPTCTVIEGCDEVALSEYATIGPVPVALMGVLFYTLMLVSGVAWLDIRKAAVFYYLPFVTVPAFFFSLWLVYLMFFVIEALCIFCLVSAGTTTLLMILSFFLHARAKAETV